MREEVDIVEKGKNYGWKIMEVSSCFSPLSGCNTAGLELPVWEYGGNSQRRSVIGGYLYRGQNNPELTGKYIYADWLLGAIWALEYDGSNPPTNSVIVSNFPGIGTFRIDEAGELLISNINNDRIYRFMPTSTSIGENPAYSPADFRLHQNHPNPFNPYRRCFG